MKKFSKIANITISFSWIFMIIVGTTFIFMTYSVIDKYKTLENSKLSIETKNSLGHILNNIGRTQGAEESLFIPINIFKNQEVEIRCAVSFPTLYLNQKAVTGIDYIKNYPTFMNYINEKSIPHSYLAVENFKAPFKITNMLAIVSKKNLIILDNNSEIVTRNNGIYEKFEKGSYDDLSYRVEDISSILTQNFIKKVENDGYDSIIFVSDKNKNLGGNKNLIDFNIKANYLKINDTYFPNEKASFGTLTFIDKNSNKYNFNYTNSDDSLSLVTMAIFSNPQTFKCSYNQLIKIMQKSYEYYLIKSKYMQNHSNNKYCSSNLNIYNIKPRYKDILNSINKTKTNFINLNFTDSKNLLKNIIKINSLQEERIESQSCIYVY